MNQRSRFPVWVPVVILGVAAFVVVGTWALIQLSPSEPGPSGSPAVLRTPQGDIEVLSCTSDEVTEFNLDRIDLVDGERTGQEVVWSIRFDPPRSLERVVLGERPDGATEVAPFRPELLVDGPDLVFTAHLELTDGDSRVLTFTLAELGDVDDCD